MCTHNYWHYVIVQSKHTLLAAAQDEVCIPPVGPLHIYLNKMSKPGQVTSVGICTSKPWELEQGRCFMLSMRLKKIDL